MTTEERIAECLRRMGSYYYLMLQVDLTNDSFMVLRASDHWRKESWNQSGSFTQALKHFREVAEVHPEDQVDFARFFGVDAIKRYFDAVGDKQTFWFRFRCKFQGVYYWLMMEAVTTDAYTEDHQQIFLNVRADLAERGINGPMLFEDVLKELGENFDSIYYVDFEADKVFPYRMNNTIAGSMGAYLKEQPNYATAIESYIERFVHENDKQEMRRICDKQFIAAQLLHRRVFSHEFRSCREDRIMYYRVQFTNVDDDGALRHGLVSFMDVSAEKQVEKERLAVGKTLLIISDDAAVRSDLKSILAEDYALIQADSDTEALRVIRERSDISLVLTDLDMTGCNGYELLRSICAARQMDSIPVIVTTVQSTSEAEVSCLEQGASDFVIKPFVANVVKNRVRSLIRLRETTAMLNTLERDPLTGLYSKDFFYRYAEDVLAANPDQQYRIVVSDIEKFRMINDKYGVQVGDEVLRHVAANATKIIPNLVFGGRISGDKFVWLQKQLRQNRKEGRDLMKQIMQDAPVPNLVMNHGIFYINDRTLPVQTMYDRARMAMQSIKGTYGVYCAVYDDSLRDEQVLQQQLVDGMEQAMTEGQFTIHFQPKHDVQSGAVGGAEALVRWQHPELGFLSPGMFVPLFEQNGFIKELDLHILERVCRIMRQWREQGMRMTPVSINLSRRDFESEDLAERIISIVDCYGLPHQWLHFEVTETAYAEHPQRMTRIIHCLHEAGFMIELDDFGSGYSSLSALNSIDLDMVKLDMSLLRQDQPGVGRSSLELSMRVAKVMQLTTVSEGVENEAQVKRLQSLGCDYIQGYYYSKPLPLEAFERYLAEHVMDEA